MATTDLHVPPRRADPGEDPRRERLAYSPRRQPRPGIAGTWLETCFAQGSSGSAQGGKQAIDRVAPDRGVPGWNDE